MRTYRRLSIMLLCLALLASPLATLPVRADCGLNNNGFEGGFTDRSGDGQVVVANGWDFWFQNGPGQEQGKNFRPTYGQSDVGYLEGRRVHGGSYAQKLGTLYATHNAGLYQRVSVTPGSQVTFTAWALAWSSSKDDTNSVTDPGEYKLSVGIDPTGGTNWAADTVQWSEPRTEYNTWIQLTISTRAQADAVTVFVRGQCGYAVVHNESVWDDACLTVVVPTPRPTNTPQPTSTPTATPTPTITPSPTPSPTPVLTNVCFQSFDDTNGNGTRESGEVPVPGAAVSLVDNSGATVAEGLTTGYEEPLCFSDVPAADYQLVVVKPAGYEATGDIFETLRVTGRPITVSLGYRRVPTATPLPVTDTPAPAATPTPAPSPSLMATVGQGLYSISGILALAAAALLLLAPRLRRRNQ